MYINDNKIHGFQHTHDSVQSRHHFVQGTVGRLPPSDHDRAPSNRTMGYSVLKTLNRKAIPSFMRLSRFTGWRTISAIISICEQASAYGSVKKKHISTTLTYRQPVATWVSGSGSGSGDSGFLWAHAGATLPDSIVDPHWDVGQKSVPIGHSPYNVFSSTSSPRDASPPIRFSGGFSKTRCTTDEMTRLTKQPLWDHPIARTLNHEVHRRKMAGKSCHFFHWQDWVPSFPHTLFFGLLWCFPISTFFGMSFGPSTFAFALDDLDWIKQCVFGSQNVMLIFLSQIPWKTNLSVIFISG